MPDVPRVAVTLTQCWHRVPGGTATSVVDLVGAIARTGAVDLVGVGPRTNVDPTPPVPAIDVARLSLPLPVLYDAWSVSRRPTIESATGPVDVVHVTVPMSPPVTPAALVATVHDLF
ncbi:MAG: glycosyltransferase family 1 protein, partial [Acidimicrobiales bacterium]